MVIQYIVTGIILLTLGQLLLRVIRDKVSIFKIVSSLIFWGLALVFIWLPSYTLNAIGKMFGVGRGVDVLIYLAIVVLFYINFRLGSKIDRLEKEITKLVREIAISNISSKK